MHYRIYIMLFIAVAIKPPLVASGQHGYTEWHDELNKYYFDEPEFQDVVPVTPYENPNPIFYDYSPYLDPNYNKDFSNPE